MVDSGLVIGTVLERDATHLLLSDGSEIFSPNESAFPDVSAGTGVAVSYLVSGGQKVAEALTIIPPVKRSGHQELDRVAWSFPTQERPRHG